MKSFTKVLSTLLTVSLVVPALGACGGTSNGASADKSMNDSASSSVSVVSGAGTTSSVSSASSSAASAAISSSASTSDEAASNSSASEASATENTDWQRADDDPVAVKVNIDAVPNISDDFVLGMDASSVLVEENSGVKYYGFDGKEQDVYKTLAEAGVNYIRLRLWNDPYDEDGNGYGGGNNDLKTDIKLGKRATEAGMKVMLDFHYSDFWADPKKQFAPKAWKDMEIDEKCDALSKYTTKSLTKMLDAGIDVGMVQIGNEINYGMSGERDYLKVIELLKAGSKAVRAVSKKYDKDIKIIIHYTDIKRPAGINSLCAKLEDCGVDYDIMGLSYYPYWDGTMKNMQSVIENIVQKYGKQAMVAETSYPYTAKDGDGSGNSFPGDRDLVEGYGANVQGQAQSVRDIAAAVSEAGGMGICYWEGVWIPVGPASDDNSKIWEKYGSGWASSYAGSYDPDDAGKYYGGCSWDNQAMFDFEGHPLDSLNVFKYIRTGSNN